MKFHTKWSNRGIENGQRCIFPLSNGEINFLWWFIQGSIMSPSTRDRLHKTWGMCERHAWGFMTVEAAFREGYMMGPSVLYEDLMDRAQAVFSKSGPLGAKRIVKNLKERAPCLMCEAGYGPHSKGFAGAGRVRRGRDTSELKAIALESKPSWQKTICGRCIGNNSCERCRRHLIEDLTRGENLDLLHHAELVSRIARHLKRHTCSFCYGYHGTATLEDRASLISAVGWCSGWATLLSILKNPEAF